MSDCTIFGEVKVVCISLPPKGKGGEVCIIWAYPKSKAGRRMFLLAEPGESKGKEVEL